VDVDVRNLGKEINLPKNKAHQWIYNTDNSD
jgi:hypothetical protein